MDEEAAIEWAERACPDAVRNVKSFLVSKLPEVAIFGAGTDTPVVVDKATGEIIPGLSAEPERTTATVKVETPAIVATLRHTAELTA